MKIDNFDLEDDIFVIAEIGNNHEGDFKIAKEMIQLAAEAGANAVKFQTIRTENLIDIKNVKRYKQLKSYEFNDSQFVELSETANKNNIIFMSTPFDISSVDFLDTLMPVYKIASSDNNFNPLLKAVAEKGKPILISSGLANVGEINEAICLIKNVWNNNNIKQDIAVLHCVSSYPVPPEDVNLKAIETIKNDLKCIPGYSDHSEGIDAAVLSIAFGARIVEKHFTIDKNYSSFRDHQLSADPEEFAELVKKIKYATKLIGNGEIKLQQSECGNVPALRRSIVAAKDLPTGKVIEINDLNWIRKEGGVMTGNENLIIGFKLKQPIEKGDHIIPNIHLVKP